MSGSSLCGKRSSFFFESMHESMHVSKRICRSIDHLSSLFFEMDIQFLERALKECNEDLDLTITSLNHLMLGSGWSAMNVDLVGGKQPEVNTYNFSVVIDHLSSLFPEIDKQFLERALKECNEDLDLTITSLNHLMLGSGWSAMNVDLVGGKQPKVNTYNFSVAIDHLSSFFPEMDKQFLKKALKECNEDLDLTITNLNHLMLGSAMDVDLVGSEKQPQVNIYNFSVAIDHLSSLFPEMDKQILERALKECNEDLDLTITNLNHLMLGSAMDEVLVGSGKQPQVNTYNNFQSSSSDDYKDPEVDNWVELFILEMMNDISDIHAARNRASQALHLFEKSIISRTIAHVAQTSRQENDKLKEQLEGLIYENGILKQVVYIQPKRQKEYEDMSRDIFNMNQTLSQYQKRLRTLELNNYALTMHLNHAKNNPYISNHFNPNVFFYGN